MRCDEMAVRLTNEHGFTLYETIFSLFVLSIVIFLIPLIISYFKHPHHEKLHPKEVELFFIQISREIHRAKSAYVENGDLIVILQNDDIASYELYKNLLRRRVNKQGHEVLLQNIQSVHFEANEKLVSIQIRGKQTRTFERKIALLGER